MPNCSIFGLAKSAAPAIATSAMSMAPTTPPNLTAQGTILGTFQFMAPEQIEGLEADPRTDIFAFGAVLFEMLTGRPAFEGKTRAQLLGAILKDEPPPVTTLRADAAKTLDRVVATCLAKDPDDRWQTARDLLRELQWVAESPDKAARKLEGDRDSTWRPSPRGPAMWATAAVLVIALAVTGTLALRHLRETAPVATPQQFIVSTPENAQFGGPPGGGTGQSPQLVISPDGQQIVFVAKTRDTHALWLRPIATLAAHQIPGTEGAAFPFWSPDSRVAFFASGKLKKVQASGGPPAVLCDAPAGRGGTWSRDNVILFSPAITGGLQRVSGSGGVTVFVTSLDAAYGETAHRWPQFLPDANHFLYTGSVGTCCPASKPARIRIGALDSKDATTLMEEVESSATFASGHLLFVREGTLMAQPFDHRARHLTNDAFPVAETIATEGSRYAAFAVSATGTLVYAQGPSNASSHLTWFDRTGKMLGTVGDAGDYVQLALSPDERRVAASRNRDV